MRAEVLDHGVAHGDERDRDDGPADPRDRAAGGDGQDNGVVTRRATTKVSTTRRIAPMTRISTQSVAAST
ncbi:hypothetical protein, partial [Streptomyces sp. NPDC050848]|uniref:hypothetical protein n=1 Tax=Streptomyces sp. NPDC050848 TaxID=3155791 RepID=UPI0033D2FA22